MPHRVTLIPGDGIGPELSDATRRVLEATGVAFDWDVREAGADVMAKHGGNPLPDSVIESIAHRRPIAVGDYPVLDELRAFGVRLLSIDDPAGVQAWLRHPDPEVLAANVELVRPHCSLADLPRRLEGVLVGAGLSEW